MKKNEGVLTFMRGTQANMEEFFDQMTQTKRAERNYIVAVMMMKLGSHARDVFNFINQLTKEVFKQLVT